MNPVKSAPVSDYTNPACHERGHDIRVVNCRVAESCARCGEAVNPIHSTFGEAFNDAVASGYDRDSAAALARVSMTFS